MMRDRPDLFPNKSELTCPTQVEQDGGWFSGLTGMISTAAGYLPYGSAVPSPVGDAGGKGLYGRSAEDLVGECNGVPSVMNQLREVIISECGKTEGIFRMTPSVSLGPG